MQKCGLAEGVHEFNSFDLEFKSRTVLCNRLEDGKGKRTCVCIAVMTRNCLLAFAALVTLSVFVFTVVSM